MKILLEASHINYDVADRLLLNIDHLQIHQGERIGLVGCNGSGKTTLLQILNHTISTEQATVTYYAQCEMIPQLKPMHSHKSGGEVTQAYIQQALDKTPELLLADEPTANLDITHIEALEQQLKHWRGSFMIVSHDRSFLDTLCTTIWELKDGKINMYKGNYNDYMKQKELEARQKQLSYQEYEKQKKHLQEAIKIKRTKAQRATKKPKNLSHSDARQKGINVYFANKQKKLQKTAKSLETRLNQLEIKHQPRTAQPLKMDILHSESINNRIIIRAEGLTGVVNNKILWKPANFNIYGGEKVAIIGDNGVGKSTLIHKIVHHDPNISLSPSAQVGYFSQNLDILNLEKSILENIQDSSKQNETLIRTVLARMHFFKDDVLKPVKVLSGGERVKVALAKIFLSNVNTLILDEPTNFLDMEAVDAFESLLQEYEGTLIFASHDRRFIEKVANRILIIENQEIHVFEGAFSQFQSEQTKRERSIKEDEKMILEMKITEVLSRLSVEPTDALEHEFQHLIQKKRELDE
ncbi:MULTISPECIES: Vga family ABC-F type ribosomal protection protein [unclassified Staphylococcus]|uniref:Vga family ABC-F type ribosomal protection protein n=1 Tax=unclassified Staphylococcus TaxID=91994 RepID=UPI0021D2E65F|nr:MULTISPECIES: ABC-F type ribosomal protection protein [unclassified Staphylococcus]UXR78441.1 ABC-F type ribosomal protection protein [Staphylococcus sp. IVB6227]UXR82598.1 ABC-F type ribosomal protection protein [Staphylococcus sp. IVB6214]